MDVKQVSMCCDALLDTLADALAGGHEVTLPRLGQFRIKQRKARTGKDPKLGIERIIPECSAVQFYPHQNIKDRLNRHV